MLFNSLLISLQNNQAAPEAGIDLKNKVRGLGVMFGDLMTKTTSVSTDVDSGVLNDNIKSVLANPDILSGIQLVIDNPEKITKSGLLTKLVRSDSKTSPQDVLESLKQNPDIKLTEIPEGTLISTTKLEALLQANSVENLPGLVIKVSAGGEVKSFLVTPEDNTGTKTNIPSLLQQLIPAGTLAPVEAEVLSAKFNSSGEIIVATEAGKSVEPISLTVVDAKKLLAELTKINSGNVISARSSDTLTAQAELPIQNSEGKTIVTEEMQSSNENPKVSDNSAVTTLYKKLYIKDKEPGKTADIIVVPNTVESNVATTVNSTDETSVPEQKANITTSVDSTHKSDQTYNKNTNVTETITPTSVKATTGELNTNDTPGTQKVVNENQTPVQESGEKTASLKTNIAAKEILSTPEKVINDADAFVSESKDKSMHNTSVDAKNDVNYTKSAENKSTPTGNMSAEGSPETVKKTIKMNSDISVSGTNSKHVVNTRGTDDAKIVSAKTEPDKIKVEEKSTILAANNKTTSEKIAVNGTSSELKDNTQKDSNTASINTSVEKELPKSTTGLIDNSVGKAESNSNITKPSQTPQVNSDKIKDAPVESTKPNLAQNPDFIKKSISSATDQSNAKDVVSNENQKSVKSELVSGITEKTVKDENIKFVASSDKVSGLNAAKKSPKTLTSEDTTATSSKVEVKPEAAKELKTVEIESISVDKKVSSNVDDAASNKNVAKTTQDTPATSVKQNENVRVNAPVVNEKVNSTRVEVKPESANELKTVKIQSLSVDKNAGTNSANPNSTETNLSATQHKAETTLLNQSKTTALENIAGDLTNNEKLSVKQKPVTGNNVTYTKSEVSEGVKPIVTQPSAKQDVKIATTTSEIPKVSTKNTDISISEITKVIDTKNSNSPSPKVAVSEIIPEVKKTTTVNSPKIDFIKDSSKIEIESDDNIEAGKAKTAGKVNNDVKPELSKSDVADRKKFVTEGSEKNAEAKAAKFAENINNRVRSVRSLLNAITCEKNETTPQLRVKSGTQQNVRSIIEQLNLGTKPKTETKGILEQLQVFAKKPEINVTGAQKTANEHFRNRILTGSIKGTSDIKSNLRNIHQYSNIDKIFVADKENSYTKLVDGSKAQFRNDTSPSFTDSDKNFNEIRKTVNVTGNIGENLQKTNKSETLFNNEIKNNADNKVIITLSSLKSNLKVSDGTELVQDIKNMFQGSSNSNVEITYKPANEVAEQQAGKTGTLFSENKQSSANLNFREREFMNAERVQQVERENENIKSVEKPDNAQSAKPKIDVEVRELFNLLEKSSDKTLLSQLKRMTGRYLAGKFEIKLIDDQPETAVNNSVSYGSETKETQGKQSVDRVTGYFDTSNSFTENENKSFTGTNSDTKKESSQQNYPFHHSGEDNKIEFKESFRFDGPGLRTDEKSNTKIETRRSEEIPAEKQDAAANQTMSTGENNTAFLSDDKENFENVKDFFNISDNKVVSDSIKTSSVFTTDDPVKHVKAKNLMPEISKFFEQKYNNSITFKITPEHLGKVRVSLKLVNDVLKASIEVENEQVKQIVENNMSSLKSTLMMNGLTTGDINVMVSNQSTKQSKYFPHQKKRDKSFTDERESVETAQMDDSTLINRRNYGYNTYEFTA
ncbi:MAG: hypothetical protein SCALA702_26780 [Melioribacteraceae bacterium]|nr:MAG: hypothetical protein SCALA702_26780 [Melioribacteraceae bacterium]